MKHTPSIDIYIYCLSINNLSTNLEKTLAKSIYISYTTPPRHQTPSSSKT